MYGTLFTLGNVARRTFMPTIAPVVLIGYEGEEQRICRILPDDDRYWGLRIILRAHEPIALFRFRRRAFAI